MSTPKPPEATEADAAAAAAAETFARVTGSVGATYTVERRNLDGTLTTIATGTYSRDEAPEAPSYEWRCFHTLTCEPTLDQHGRECERLNDEAREDFYADLVAEDIGNIVTWWAAEAFHSANREGRR